MTFKTGGFFKSGGVPVSGALYHVLRSANKARGARRWQAAADLYRDAVTRDPSLFHIWIQLGHALKEAGQFSQAEEAYRSAAGLQPKSAEPYLHLGHQKKVTGDVRAAGRFYLQAVELDGRCEDAIGELHALAMRGCSVSREQFRGVLVNMEEETGENTAQLVRSLRQRAESLTQALETGGAGLSENRDRAAAITQLLTDIQRDMEQAREPSAAAAGPVLAFDVSDLVSHFRNARLPTGIQRVQIETIVSALLKDTLGAVKVCCFVERRDSWLEINRDDFLRLCYLSLASGDRAAPQWIGAVSGIYLKLSLADDFAFPLNAFLVNLGTSWWLQNYFLFVRNAKRQYGIRYVPFVHDLIPILASEHCTENLTRDFLSWVVGVFEHADYYLVNSDATRRDLVKVAGMLGRDVAQDRIEVVHLDADFRKPGHCAVSGSGPEKWGLGDGPFVLFVSTVESRKNHLCAFDAWLRLIRKHGIADTPYLVCVGNRGWLNDAVYARLATHRGLRERVVMLSGISDQELSQLYTHCLFTLYPSVYEGWGLPVTESLCYGKVPLISDSSSLPEAGGRFAVYFESGNTPGLVRALEQLIHDPVFRDKKEAEIRSGFKPRSWSDIADQMNTAIKRWDEYTPPRTERAHPATMGAYHPLKRSRETSVWSGMRSGEIFRVGAGWWAPCDWGCWTKPSGGQLVFGVPGAAQPLCLHIRLRGLMRSTCRYELTVGSQTITGVLARGKFRWVSVRTTTEDIVSGAMQIFLHGLETQGLAADGIDGQLISVGVAGFFLCAADDGAARLAFLEAVSLGNLDDIGFASPSDQRNATRAPPIDSPLAELLESTIMADSILSPYTPAGRTS